MNIAISELRQKVLQTLSKNFKPEEAEKIAEYLLWADMSGNKTQGTIKLTGTSALQDVEPEHEIQVERDTKLSQLIDAGKNPAPLVSQQATDVVIQKAKEHGFGIVGVHNIFSSTGAQAFYAERIAKENLIGVVLARAPASVAVFGGIDPLFGTNPIGFSFPTNDEPVVFDMATSAMTWYGLVLASARGEQIPENMAIDKNGNPTTDPAEAMDGSLLPFDRNYKGAGIGMIIEFFGGPLVGAAYGQVEGEWGALFMAIDPELLIDIDKFKTSNSDLVRKIKASRKKDGVTEIRLPGERALRSRKEAEETGYVEVDDTILKQLGYV
jgi:L-2-hydroxycarboxylate dehydrogenase (NAD+)